MLYVPNPFQQIGTYRGCSIEKHDAKECNLIENDVVHDIVQSIVNIFSRCSCSCAEAIKETQRSNYTYQVVPFQGYDQTEEPPYGYVWQRINNGFRYIGIELVGIGSVNLRIFPQFNNKLITWGYLQAGEEISGIMSRETNREVDPKCINILKIIKNFTLKGEVFYRLRVISVL